MTAARQTRRAALAGLAVTPLVGATAAAAAPLDPHPAWFAERRAVDDLISACFASGEIEDMDGTPLAGRLDELQDLILGTPATSLAGAAAQRRSSPCWSVCRTSMWAKTPARPTPRSTASAA